MKSFTLVSLLAFATYVSAQANGGPPFDPAGVKNVGNGAGGQFIGGQCLSGADCGSGCCAGPSGICSGVGAQTQAGKTGCGFTSGSSSLNNGAAAPPPAAAAPPAAGGALPPNIGGPPFDPAGVKNVGNGAGGQFIGGQCLSGADCGSGCCAGPSGICSGVGAQTQAGKTGCGFTAGSSSLNNGAAAPPPAAAAPPPPPPAAAAAPPPNVGGPPFDPAGVKNVGNGKGTQFIGGQCLNAADCASGCCAGPSGICSGVGAQTQAGKTGCGFTAGASSLNNGAAAPPPPPAAAAAPPANVGGPPFDPAGVKNVGNGAGGQFIGGQCLSGADCGSGCCAGPSGICSGVGAQTQAGKTGCGFIAKRFVSRRGRLL
ncbi:unnamed protein product [Mycena citricolor]|uniref:Biotrophy-associated secreted protein 2 n=1 Tax=Mycena citricolor TaxID=2018698 RepID=A0AAD2HEV0_9AGAR|nr:unnamed protein product [Mycena citricolor]